MARITTVLLMLACTVLLMLACARAAEYASPEATVAAYASVFKARGDPTLVGVSPPVRYAEDRLRVLLGRMDGLADGLEKDRGRIDLARVRTLDQAQLLALLFKAVAGDYTTGPSDLGGACHFMSDPGTGVLELYHDESDSTTVLTVMSIVLLSLLFALASRGDGAAGTEQSGADNA